MLGKSINIKNNVGQILLDGAVSGFEEEGYHDIIFLQFSFFAQILGDVCRAHGLRYVLEGRVSCP